MEFIQNNWDKIITIFFAGLSALFAFITVCLMYLDYKRDNPKIKARVSRGFLTYTDGNLVDCMICGITNHGRRAVSISQIYFSVKGGGSLVFLDNCNMIAVPVNLPFLLSESKNKDVYFYLEEVKSSIKQNNKKLEAVCFKDETGKTYKAKIKKRKWKDLYK